MRLSKETSRQNHYTKLRVLCNLIDKVLETEINLFEITTTKTSPSHRYSSLNFSINLTGSIYDSSIETSFCEICLHTVDDREGRVDGMYVAVPNTGQYVHFNAFGFKLKCLDRFSRISNVSEPDQIVQIQLFRNFGGCLLLLGFAIC